MQEKLKSSMTQANKYLPLSLSRLVDRLFGHLGFKRYLFNTGWMFSNQILNLAVAFFVTAAVARYLGPERYGLINYAVSFVGLFGFLVGFGVDAILNRELVRTPERKDTLIANGLFIKFWGALTAIVIVNGIALAAKNDSVSRLLIFLLSLTFVFQIFGVINLYFQSKVLSKINFQAQLISTIITTSAKLAGIYFKFGVDWFICIYLLDAIVGAAAILHMYRRYREYIHWGIDWPIVRELLRDSWPLMFTMIATTIYLDIDQIMLKFMMGAAAVGVYSIAVKLSEVWYFIPSIICASLFPAIVNAKKTNQQSYFSRLGKLYRLMIGMALLVALPVTVFAGLVIPLLFGSAYLGAIHPLRIYVWSGIPAFLMFALVQYLITENYTKIYFFATILGAISNVALNLLFIPRYGIAGSAWATFISYWAPVIAIVAMPKTRGQMTLIIKG